MTRAEEKAKNRYPEERIFFDTQFGRMTLDKQHDLREGFVEGYEQAEKDRALNWNDITFGVPDKFGNSDFVEVLCKVKTPDGFCKHMVLRFDEDGNWWMYLPRLGPAFGGGWCGIGDTRILEWAYIED